MASWLSSTGISHHNLLPHIPSISLSTANSSPHPGIAQQSLNSSSQLLGLSETSIPVQHMYGWGQDCLILIPFRLPQIRCFTLSLKCFSSDPDNCPDVEIEPLLQFPHPPRAGSVLPHSHLSPLVPLSYGVLHGSIYSFPVSCTPVHSQLVFCMYVCFWRCVPDGFVVRNVLHVHILLCHLVLLLWNTFLNKCGYVIHHFNSHFSLYAFLLITLFAVYFIFILD